MNDKTLFIVAAGLSTRFNGQPKHLAQVNGNSVIVNTLTMAKRHYRDIWVVLNERADSHIIDMTVGLTSALGVNVVEIPSGKGDADAVYQALVKTGCSKKNVSVCWGDSWFTDETIFETAARRLDESRDEWYVFDAMCAYEVDPYGWFDTYGNNQISRCTFVSDLDHPCKKGVSRCHDQCFFNIDVSNFMLLYETYLPEIKRKAQEAVVDLKSRFYKLNVQYEVSWYKMVNWALAMPLLPHPMPCSIVTVLDKPMARSFNTYEDLEEIEKNA